MAGQGGIVVQKFGDALVRGVLAGQDDQLHVPLQGGEDRVVYGGKYLALLAELHLGLGGVDVHIHSGQL